MANTSLSDPNGSVPRLRAFDILKYIFAFSGTASPLLSGKLPGFCLLERELWLEVTDRLTSESGNAKKASTRTNHGGSAM